MSEQVKLRGHHLLCLMAFKGKGYNSAFINNLKSLQERIKKEKNLKIKIVNGSDDICSACPHLKGSICCKDGEESNLKICLMDDDFIEKMSLNQNDIEIDFSKLIKAISQIPKDEIKKLCSTCSWLKTEDCPKTISSFIRSFST